MDSTKMRNNRDFSVTVKLQLLVFAIVLLIIGVQAGLNIKNARQRDKTEAEQNLLALYDYLNDEVEILERTAASLSLSLASRPDVQERFQARDRQGLLALLQPVFITLKTDYDIVHIQFHEPSGHIFLRVHAPEQYGDYTFIYRRASARAIISRQTVAGVEIDPNRLGIQSVSPMFYQGQFIGLVEVGLNYDRAFIQDFKARHGADCKMWVTHRDAAPAGLGPVDGAPEPASPELFYYAGTNPMPMPIPTPVYQSVLQGGESQVQFVSAGNQEWAVLVAPMLGYGNRTIGILEISVSRAEAQAVLQNSQRATLAVAGGLSLVALALMVLSTSLVVLRPLRHLTSVAQRQLAGDLTARVELLPRDEFGQLGHTFNVLTGTLDNTLKNQEQIIAERAAELVAANAKLQKEVQERKRAAEALRESEQRMELALRGADLGTWDWDVPSGEVTFNERWAEMLGYRLDEIEPHLSTWEKLVHPDDLPHVMDALNPHLEGKSDFYETEHRVKHKSGAWVWILDKGRVITRDAEGRPLRACGTHLDITARKEAEDALRQAEEKYRNIVENAIEGIFQSTPDGRFLSVNPAMARMHGYASPEEMVQRVTDIGEQLYVDPNRRSDLKRRLETEGAVQGFEMQFRRKDGAILWGLENVRTVQDEQGRILYYEGMLADITARKQAEQALRASEERLRLVLDATSDGVWDWNIQTDEIYRSPAGSQMSGLGAGETCESFQSWQARLRPQDREQVLNAVQEHLEGKVENYRTEFRVETKPGHWRWILARGKLVGWDAGGNPMRMVGTTTDITPLKQVEQALRESEQKFRSVIEQAYDAIVLSDPQGVVIEWNQAAEKLTGYSRAEMLGRPFWEVQFELLPAEKKTPAARERFLTLDSQRLTGEAPWLNQSLEVELQKADGTRCYSQQVAFPIQLAQGFMIGAFVRDITERKKTERELRRYREHLEELVKARTRELEQAQAELLRKERLSTLGQLTATVAHEIRNPLGTVRTAVFAIGDALERDELHRLERARQLAERNIVRCDRIITELLDYTRERALDLRPTRIDAWLDRVLDAVWQESVPPIIPAGIVCSRELTSGIEVPIDGEHLRRAVINVVNNALDALKDSAASLPAVGNELTVSTRVVSERLEIRVSDTGPGIPEEVMDRIFEPLFSTKSFGVGLGMSIVRKIMRQHGGGVEIESRTGQPGPEPVERGTTVTLWLPLADTDRAQFEGGR